MNSPYKQLLLREWENAHYEKFFMGNWNVMRMKGFYGLPGVKDTDRIPQWVKDIIEFRNEKYREDTKPYDHLCALNKERIDQSYDKIDAALGQMISATILIPDDPKKYGSNTTSAPPAPVMPKSRHFL